MRGKALAGLPFCDEVDIGNYNCHGSCHEAIQLDTLLGPYFPRHVYVSLMSTVHQPNQWRIPTDDELADFEACCWLNSAAQFQCENSVPKQIRS